MRAHVGMVFQQFNLFPHLTVLQNCTVAQERVLKRPRSEAETIARKRLAAVGFAREVADHVVFMNGGVVVEQGHPEDLIGNPKEPRTQDFLRRVLDPTHVEVSRDTASVKALDTDA